MVLNLFDKQVVQQASNLVKYAHGVGVYVDSKNIQQLQNYYKKPLKIGQFISNPNGKGLDSVVADPMVIYDVLAFDVDTATNTIVRPSKRYELFSGETNIQYMDGSAQVVIGKNDNHNNLRGTQGNQLGNNDAFAALGLIYEVSPNLGPRFLNWLTKILTPTVSMEIGKRTLERFKQKMSMFYNYNNIDGFTTIAGAGIANDVPLVNGKSEKDGLPTMLWNMPILFAPNEKLKVNVDFTNVPTQISGNYPLSPAEMQMYAGGSNASVTLAGKFLFVHVGFVGVRGYTVA
jgi:hypothetical protein